MLASSRVISIFSSSSHEHSYTSASHAMLATCALQSTFRIIVCVTDALDDQTEAPFVAGLAASTGSDVGKIVIGKARPVHWRTSAAPKYWTSQWKLFQPYGNLVSLIGTNDSISIVGTLIRAHSAHDTSAQQCVTTITI